MIAETTLTQKIIELLTQNKVEYIIKEHAPTPTSEDSARERGESKKIGAKALLFKIEKKFILTILPADRQVDSKILKSLYKAKNIRMATLEELQELTGCEKGAVPPFGLLLTPTANQEQSEIDMIIDQALFDEEYMAFNAGSLTTSIKMKTSDYKKILNPKIENFTKENNTQQPLNNN